MNRKKLNNKIFIVQLDSKRAVPQEISLAVPAIFEYFFWLKKVLPHRRGDKKYP
jgi:hypothetical protein